MRWMLARIGTLIGTALAAVSGVGCSQSMAFVQAYLQRLGGHIDETARTVAGLRNGDIAPAIDDPVARDSLVVAFEARLAELEAARAAITESAALWQPVALLNHMDRGIAERTANEFVPAIPLDPPSLAYALAGLVLGWIVWGAVTWPMRRRGPRRHAQLR